MIGVDLVKIERIQRFTERFGDKALGKFLNDKEIKLAKNIDTVAGFWAAKEAISKALGLGISTDCSFFDIEICKDSKNRPYFKLAKHLIDRFEIVDLSLSIAHDSGFAIAVAHIECKKPNQKDIEIR